MLGISKQNNHKKMRKQADRQTEREDRKRPMQKEKSTMATTAATRTSTTKQKKNTWGSNERRGWKEGIGDQRVRERWVQRDCLFVGCLLNVPATWKCISGMDLLRQLYMLPHWDRSCRSNFPSHPVTVYWHQANQSQHWPYNARRLAG